MDDYIGELAMRHVDLWKAKLKAAKAEQRIVVRQYNAAERALHRLSLQIENLEKKIERKLANSER